MNCFFFLVEVEDREVGRPGWGGIKYRIPVVWVEVILHNYLINLNDICVFNLALMYTGTMIGTENGAPYHPAVSTTLVENLLYISGVGCVVGHFVFFILVKFHLLGSCYQ